MGTRMTTHLCPLFGTVCDFSNRPITSADICDLVYKCRRDYTHCERYVRHMAARAARAPAAKHQLAKAS